MPSHDRRQCKATAIVPTPTGPSGSKDLQCRLVHAARSVACDPARKNEWANSDFLWLKALEIKERGQSIALIVERFLAERGFKVESASDTDSDRLVNGTPVEIKGCMISEQGYTFGQIRNQEWNILVLVTLHPDKGELWAVPKRVFEGRFKSDPGLKGFYKHHGTDDNPNTWQLKFATVPDWLKSHGGSLEKGLNSLCEALSR